MKTVGNVYIWIQHNAIIIARGNNIEEAYRNLQKYYRKSSLVEQYDVMCYDGYQHSPDIVLYGEANEQENLLPPQYKHVVKEAVIINVNTVFKEKEKEIVKYD